MSLSEIDFARLYRERMQGTGRPERTPEYWNGRAQSLGKRTLDSSYVREFMARMDFSGCRTLLDVGCGPGAIALSAAPRLERVFALDYSQGMLAALEEHARERGIQSVTPILRSWDDDWSDIPLCDLVVASRSTAVPDIEAAILKLDSKARHRVYITYPADGHFVADAICRAIGRPERALPDYLFVVGVLHHLGLHPTLDYLPGENRFAKCENLDEFRAKVGDVLGDLSDDEERRLRAYYEENREAIGKQPMRWALFSWQARPKAE